MRGAPLAFALLAATWLAGLLQIGLAPHLAIGYGMPDFGLIALGTLCFYCDRRGLTIFGFGVGWVTGALAGQNLTLYVMSRVVAGFLLGWSLGLGIQRNFMAAAIATVSITLIANLLMLFAGAHKGPLTPNLVGTLVTTVYDGVIAAILFGVVTRFTGPRYKDHF